MAADDHALLVAGLQARFRTEPDIEFVGTANRLDALPAVVRKLRPHVLYLDIQMPGGDAFEVARDLLAITPELRIIMLTAYIRDHYIEAATAAGAVGYLCKKDEIDEIVEAARRVVRGEFVLGRLVEDRCELQRNANGRPVPLVHTRLDTLTERELEVLRLIGRGMSRQEIADALSRSARTIDNHRAAIMRKLGIRDRVDLVRYAIREGLVEV